MIYEFDSDAHLSGAYKLFYQPDLAEDGFLTVLYHDHQTLIRYVDLNTKILFNLSLKDHCLCGKLNSQRTPWRHQLALILGFQSGYLRIINILKND